MSRLFLSALVLLMVATMAQGQPFKPKKVKCQDKNFPDCYHKKLLCPATCLRHCEVDCASCQPVCKAVPPPPPMKVRCRDRAFPACRKRDDLYCPATCPTSCEVDCQTCEPKCTPPKGKKVQCTDNKNFPNCYRKNLYCPDTCPEDCDVDCASCQTMCKPLQVKCTDPFYKKSCKKSLYCPFGCPTTCTVDCGNCTTVCPPPSPTPTTSPPPPPIVDPIPPPPPSPPVVTPSPTSPPEVSPSPSSPPVVTPSPTSPPEVSPSPSSPPVVTPSPTSPPEVSPSPQSPPVVTPSPTSPPEVSPSPSSPPVVTPSPASPPEVTPSPPVVTPSPSSPPSPPTQSPPPDSSEVASGRRVRCRNKNYTTCYRQEHRCPAACPDTCEVDCVTCSPICNCNMPGAVCQDPRFVGADGITFYFHGKKGREFCIVSDNNLHINAHFIGRRNENMGRDFTWVQSLGILFDNHQILVGAKKTAIWDNDVDRLELSYDGLPILLNEGEGAEWTSQGTTIKRARDTNSVIIEVEGNFQIKATVVPITTEDSKIHKYGVTDEDCLAHLDLGFKFYTLSGDVSGVLGQTYASNYVSRVKMGIDMPVLGGQREFASSGLFSTDCSVARFKGTQTSGANNFEYANLKCESGLDGRGVVCKR